MAAGKFGGVLKAATSLSHDPQLLVLTRQAYQSTYEEQLLCQRLVLCPHLIIVASNSLYVVVSQADPRRAPVPGRRQRPICQTRVSFGTPGASAFTLYHSEHSIAREGHQAVVSTQKVPHTDMRRLVLTFLNRYYDALFVSFAVGLWRESTSPGY